MFCTNVILVENVFPILLFDGKRDSVYKTKDKTSTTEKQDDASVLVEPCPRPIEAQARRDEGNDGKAVDQVLTLAYSVQISHTQVHKVGRDDTGV